MTVDEQEKVAIRTPDQRLRVFVSSTLTELAEERAAVRARRPRPGVDGHTAHPRHVDDETAVARGVARRAVSA